jgi:Bacterial Ig domain
MEFQIRTKTKSVILSMCFGLGLILIACTGPESVKEIPSFNLISSKAEISSAESISLTASVADGVTRVEFFRGTTKLGEDTQAPFTQVVPLTNADNGELAFSARAFDATGLVGASKQVSVTVGIFLWAKEFDTEVSGNLAEKLHQVRNTV